MATHITETPHGYRAHIRIHGILHQQRFPKDTDPADIRTWLLAVQLKHRRAGAKRTGKFGDDSRAYLAAVASMPTFEQRKHHIEAWVTAFGEDRRTLTIRSDEIRAQLHAWRTDAQTVRKGAHRTVEQVLSPAACNKRRTALMHLFTVLYGKAEPNPVRDVPKMAEPSPAPRALPYALIRRLFKAMPPSRAKAHLMVIAFTGIPPGQITQIQEDDVDLKRRTVAVAGRQKGKGTPGRIVPLTDDGVAAFKMMRREDGFGAISRKTLRTALRRAALKVLGKEAFTPYDLRHSFGTEIYRRSGDIRATQVLLDHSTPTLTHRYTGAAVDPRVAAALKKWKG